MLFTILLAITIKLKADDVQELNIRLDSIENSIKVLYGSIEQQNQIIKKIKNNILLQFKKNQELEDVDNSLKFVQKNIKDTLSTIGDEISVIKNAQSNDRITLQKDIQNTNHDISTYFGQMNFRTKCVGGLLALSIFSFGGYLYIKRRKDSTSIDEIRKAQKALQTAQTNIQEDSIKLDNQMLLLVDKQMSVAAVEVSVEADHSLVLKVADEIVRIELNLSRMNTSVKGYKQLSKAVERIKNNFKANGYEIVDMLGKPYVEGMKVVANFVSDDTLNDSEQIITGVTKPQINYNGKMIQSAQITVSQNI